MYQLTASIVTYNTDINQLKKVVKCFLNTKMNVKLYIIDNSPKDKISKYFKDNRIEYLFTGENLGYGKAHNIALKKTIFLSPYHIILNPDIFFEKETIENLHNFALKNPQAGLIMPKVLYPNGEIQFLCKLLPKPINLIFRKFCPIKYLTKKIDYNFEMHFTDYEHQTEVPYLSGCFMFLNTTILKEVGFFDEKIFMYCEDLDLSRRIFSKSKNIYYPKISIYHEHAKESYKNKKLLKAHIKSAIYYFNKYGWFIDKKRYKINKEIKNKYLQ